MTRFFDPFNADKPLMTGCSCGRHDSQAEHDAVTETQAAIDKLRAQSETAEFEQYSNEFIEATLVKAIFPHEPTRRNFLAAVGKSTAMAAIASVF
ncbi:MAG TPA: hypothetical protein VN066_09870, partial [Rhodocyclaceae bacterium]|nr:hypothetical protein [Rhodocyclaceae bacterium]